MDDDPDAPFRTPAKKRVRLDDDGWPLSDSDKEEASKLLAHPAPSAEKQAQAMPGSAKKFQEHVKKKAPPPRQGPSPDRTTDLTIGLCKLECYKSKSYIRVMGEGRKWRLLCGLDAKRYPGHQGLMELVWEQAVRADADKQAMCVFRDQLLNEARTIAEVSP